MPSKDLTDCQDPGRDCLTPNGDAGQTIQSDGFAMPGQFPSASAPGPDPTLSAGFNPVTYTLNAGLQHIITLQNSPASHQPILNHLLNHSTTTIAQ
jgi:hypothetical protein